MKKYYIIESTKTRKNGHVSHLMIKGNDDTLYEISPKTGKLLAKQDYWKLEDYLNIWNYKVIDKKNANFTGGLSFPFIDYLEEKGLI